VQVTIADVLFKSNSALNGGAILIAGSSAAEIVSSTFEANSAGSCGGGLATSSPMPVKLTGPVKVSFSPETHSPGTLHPKPCSLHPAPCFLLPTPYFLHPTPCTLHPTPYTLHPHPTPFTLNPTPFTLNPAPSTLNPKSETTNPSP